MDRSILHVDCNSFFASVECVSHPEYKNVPMAVCGDPDARHGIILAKNELAKKYKIVTAETIWSAKKKCPDLVTVLPHFDEYVKFSKLANEIYERYTSLVEPFSIDESWLDVTGSSNLFGSGFEIAERIRREVREELGITVSIGVSFNKIYAKLGSDYKKPDATTVISRENYKDVVFPLPVSDLLFIGSKTAQSLVECNIKTIGDLANTDVDFLCRKYGKMGIQMHRYAAGEDDSPVDPESRNEDRKSLGRGMTFRRDITSDDDVRTGIIALSEEVAARLRRAGYKANGIQLTVKDSFLSSLVRQMPLKNCTDTAKDLTEGAMELYMKMKVPGKSIRMLTVTASPLCKSAESSEQLSIFDTGEERQRTRKLESALDAIREKFGDESIVNGSRINNNLGIGRKKD